MQILCSVCSSISAFTFGWNLYKYEKGKGSVFPAIISLIFICIFEIMYYIY